MGQHRAAVLEEVWKNSMFLDQNMEEMFKTRYSIRDVVLGGQK